MGDVPRKGKDASLNYTFSKRWVLYIKIIATRSKFENMDIRDPEKFYEKPQNKQKQEAHIITSEDVAKNRRGNIVQRSQPVQGGELP